MPWLINSIKLLVFLPILIYFHSIHVYATNIPFSDDYIHHLDQIISIIQADTLSEKLAVLFSNSLQTLMLFNKISIPLIYSAWGEINLKIFTFIGNSALLGTIFGTSPGMRFHTAVNKFCWQAVMRTPLTVWKTAYDQKRPYLDLTDAVRTMAYFLKSDQFDGRVYNIVSLNATVREVVDLIKIFIPDPKIEFVNSRIMNQLSYEVLTTHLDEKNFIFQGDIRQGIKDTISLLKQAAPQKLTIQGIR
jgi:hypothetical protein